ncbi:hypothetical protein [Psychrobacter immobilis]|uniref:hypothetical protein n=1 Tax=Psychrobacter immobilis TaxID=498 RepID=UPI003FCFE886
MDSIAIAITNKAFLPEAYAYKEYFSDLGYYCELVDKDSDTIMNYDAVVLFHGFNPFWKKYPSFVIGEYHSLSTGKFNRVKDLLKRVFNKKSDIYIFLNEDVRKKLWFSNNTKYIIRGMGYNQKDFQDFRAQKKVFDIVYCGSYRKGVVEQVHRLANMGLTIAVAGMDDVFQNDNIMSFGRVSPEESRKIMSKARFGLNYTPDVFPLNIQDSTKVIEYCAAGLGVITNRYKWIDEFENERKGRFLDLNDIFCYEDVYNFNYLIADVKDLSWDNVINFTQIDNLLKK